MLKILFIKKISFWTLTTNLWTWQGATSETVYLPGLEPWYDVRSGAVYKGGDYYKIPVTMEAIPVFQRGGTIIPRKERARRSSTQTQLDPYTLVIICSLHLHFLENYGNLI
jgi:alpha-glucosidase (family GH31 glycosyl hydrolase)